MSRFFPSRTELDEWGPQQWVGYISGVIGIVAALGGGAIWAWDRFGPSEDVGTETATTPTGRLGLTFEQGGTGVPVTPMPEADRKPFYYAYDLTLEPVSFKIHLPRRYCDGSVDARSTPVLVRIVPVAEKDDLAAQYEGPNKAIFLKYFPDGGGYAGPHFAQTELWFEPSTDGLFGFNYFVKERFSDVTEKNVTITAASVENLKTRQNLLAAGTPFLMLVGVEAAQCRSNSAPGIELIRVRFE